jgi:hypothetical protein
VAKRSRWRWVLAAPLAAVAALAAIQAGVDGATSLPTLTVSETDGIAIELGAVGSTADAIVTVVNPGDADAHLTVRLAAEGTLPQAVHVAAEPGTVAAHDAARITLTFTQTEATSGGPGSVVIGAEGFAPAVVPVSIAAATSASVGVVPVLAFALIAGLVFVGLRLATLSKDVAWNGRLGSVRWDFGRSWATNITTVGAILGTVTAAGLLPQTGRSLVPGEVAGLSVFFGLLAVLSGFVYTVLSRPVLDLDEPARQGWVLPFVIAAGMTIVAVVGELTTLVLLLVDGALAGSNVEIAVALLFLVVAAGGLVLVYAWSTMGWTLVHLVTPPAEPAPQGQPIPGTKGRPVPGTKGGPEPGTEGEAEPAPPLPKPPPGWALL